ncbi:hypothetical protein ASG49_18050 [Marmoricola sp. Leaf446]|uniref:hypothetical protein n=1 Tax=Marmoricola sp. Leaf446 TaxID=1736379 RepID=UPI0006FCBD9B|nr:hypothetical protein [Marmoricola sp. Leaf446]KQT89623.1 hypothetical protein ASG49_18050 [Marmoricola sp. Leaf446]
MSTVHQGAPVDHDRPEPDAPRPATPREVLLDAVVVLVWSLVAGVVGALVWWQATPLPQATATPDGPALTADALAGQVAVDGWFAVVAVVLGLLSGLVLLAWRRRDPLLSVALVVLGAALAAQVAVRLGEVLGPADPAIVLDGRAEGAQAPLQLALQAPGLVWVWPAAAALGALLHLFVLRRD